MRDHSNHIQLSYAQAVEAILGACNFSPNREAVELEKSYGRVLAVDATAQLDMPNSLTCSLDSVAVHWADFANGMPDTSTWQQGVQWEFANTGVAMPEGFDTAIVIEHVILDDKNASIAFDAAPSKQYAGTRPAGSQMHKGDVLVSAGTTITPLLAAYIASGGNTHAMVLTQPKVAFIPTGNELVAPAADIPLGANIESNSLLMRGKILQWGGIPVIYPICKDDPHSLEQALRDAVAKADIVVLNAGSSKGSDDYSLEVLEKMGQVLYHQTNHGPGHHSSCSVVEGVPVIGISGPPGGAAFTTDFYLKPAMDAYFGRTGEPVRLRVRLAGPLPQRKPSNKHTNAEIKNNLVGEDRPRESGEFFGVRQLTLALGADGVLEAHPAASAHLRPPEAEKQHAYYLQPSGSDDTPTQPGDFIEVFLRS